MTSARLRLAALLLGLTALWVVFWVVRPVGEQDLRDLLEPLGWTAPVAYVALSAVLGVLLVPGALLAAVAGLLFGAVTGTAATMAAAVLSALLARVVAERTGRAGVAEVPSTRLRGMEAVLERRGLWAVIVQRLLPVVPDGPANHAAGLLRVSARHLALGTLIGSLPRGVAYVVLGDGVAGRDGGQAALGAGIVVLTGVLGLALGAREVRRARRGATPATRRPSAPAAPDPPG